MSPVCVNPLFSNMFLINGGGGGGGGVTQHQVSFIFFLPVGIQKLATSSIQYLVVASYSHG